MRRSSQVWVAILLVAMSAGLVVGILAEAESSSDVDRVRWDVPDIESPTVDARPSAEGWWRSMPSPEAWPTQEATSTPVSGALED